MREMGKVDGEGAVDEMVRVRAGQADPLSAKSCYHSKSKSGISSSVLVKLMQFYCMA